MESSERMDDLNFHDVANTVKSFHSDGYVVIDNVIDKSRIAYFHDLCMGYYRYILDYIRNHGKEFGIGVKYGYKEIVQRHVNRFEIAVDADPTLNQLYLELADDPYLQRLASSIFESDDYHIVNKSIIISLPEAKDQAWHCDGPHRERSKYLPCHCYNVFIPLIDVCKEHGPTEFRPESHILTRDMQKLFLPALLSKKIPAIDGPCLKKGSILLFDYRILHRGTANVSGVERPCLVITYGKKSFSDILNFPKKSLFAISNSEIRDDRNDQAVEL